MSPVKRAYSSESSSVEFFEAFHVSLVQQKEARDQEREDRKAGITKAIEEERRAACETEESLLNPLLS